MRRADLLALAARVEAAAAADRALDAEIAPACGWSTYPVGWWMAPDGNSHSAPPAYTASLDAAAALVPAGFAWSLYGGVREERNATAYCIPNGGKAPWPAWVNDVDAATPALALTAAALRARAEEADDAR